MKLAQRLLEKSQDKERAIELIKGGITVRMDSISERGGTSDTYTFHTVNKDIRNEIIQWLRREGFQVNYISSDMISFNWRQVYVGLAEQIDLNIERMKVGTSKGFTMKVDHFITDNEVYPIIGDLQVKGYQVDWDPIYREICIRWGE